jgi:hypothetical protein
MMVSSFNFVVTPHPQLPFVQMFLGNVEKVYILDKAEANAEVINGHPAWGAVWCVATLLIGVAL